MSTLTYHNRSPLFHLRFRWILFALSGLALIAGGYLYLLSRWAPEYAVRWLGLSGLVVAYLLWVLWRGLPENIRSGEVELLPVLGLGNILTLLRGLLVAALAGFLFSPRPEGWQAWIPGLLYTLAALLDYVDGWAARATGHATRLGERLDLSLDGVGVFIAALLAVQYGQAPTGYLAIALPGPCSWLACGCERASAGFPITP
jgi:CDP-diacylglycerol--glycerol-3-phosphate 3-phosphatidyltransferase